MPQDPATAALERAAPPSPPPSLAKQVAKGAVWMVAIRFASRTLGLISTLVIARILVPADFGLVAIATAFATSISALSEVGLREALIRHPEDARDLYDTAFTMQAMRGLLTGAVVAAAAPFAGHWFGEPRVTAVLLVLAVLAVAAGFENIAIAEFQRNFRFGMEFALQILPRLLQVATAIVAALLLRSYWALMIAIAVSALSRLIATYAVHPHRSRFTLQRWRDLVGFSFWTWMTSLANIVWQRADAFIIAPAFGAATFGLYTLAWEVGRLPATEIIAPISAALFPGFAEARRRGDADALAPIAVVTFLILLAAPFAVVTSAAAGPLVLLLLGPKWLAARAMVSIIAIICVLAPISWVVSNLLTAKGRVANAFVIVAIAGLARVGMFLHAVQSADINVVAWWAVASAAVYALIAAVALRLSGELRVQNGLGGIARALAASAASVAALWATGWGWRAAAPTSDAIALFDCARIALLVAAVFAITVGLLWRLAGSPHGTEARMASMLRPLYIRLRRPVAP